MIVLDDTLIEQLDDDEIVAVVSHELGHWKKNHIYWEILLSSVLCFIRIYLFKIILTSPYLKKELFYECDSFIVKCFYAYYIFQIFETLVEINNNAFSKACEKEADRFVVSLGFGEQLKSALYNIHIKNFSCIENDKFYSILFNSHPTLKERFELVEEELNKSKFEGWKQLDLESTICKKFTLLIK